ncbi:uncharacterized protein LOC117319379 [Pecten maximus]|uniref:uncharacterized protein LOC117319379 n=1 Tax=Pecten maximus TaxID=6579 RepID=UPI001457E8EE|nr:uncharacterized protein LOC117319379 [Pecten maximus]
MITPKDQQLFPDPGFFRGIHLKKTIKDKCRIFGETTMYYGNAGSVQVLSPIPGSPSPDTEPMIDRMRADCPERSSLVRSDHKDKAKKKKSIPKNKISSSKITKGFGYSLPPIANVHTTIPSKETGENPKLLKSTEECKPINLPSLRTSRNRKRLPKGNNSSTRNVLYEVPPPRLRTDSLPSLRIKALVVR